MFIQGKGDWTLYRKANQSELDLHPKPAKQMNGPREKSFEENMCEVHDKTLEALTQAYRDGKESLLVIHGKSTSRPGKKSSRSVVRALMRGKESTPYINRAACVQHGTVFLAVLKHKL